MGSICGIVWLTTFFYNEHWHDFDGYGMVYIQLIWTWSVVQNASDIFKCFDMTR